MPESLLALLLPPGVAGLLPPGVDGLLPPGVEGLLPDGVLVLFTASLAAEAAVLPDGVDDLGVEGLVAGVFAAGLDFTGSELFDLAIETRVGVLGSESFLDDAAFAILPTDRACKVRDF